MQFILMMNSIGKFKCLMDVRLRSCCLRHDLCASNPCSSSVCSRHLSTAERFNEVGNVHKDTDSPRSSLDTPFIMAATLQRLVISLLVILTFTFVYFAQVTEAAGKGPRITNKVCPRSVNCTAKQKLTRTTGLLRHHTRR
jgi:hypothetical protein